MATRLLIITFNAILLTFNVCYRLPIVYYYITGTLFIFKCGKCGTTLFAFNRTHPALFTDCRNISHFWLHFAFFAYFRKFPLHEFCQCFQPTFLTSFTLLNRGKSPFEKNRLSYFASKCPIEGYRLSYFAYGSHDMRSCYRSTASETVTPNRVTVTRHRGPISKWSENFQNEKNFKIFLKLYFCMFRVISIILRKIAFRTLLPNFQSGEIAFRTLLPNFQSREIAFRTLLTDPMTCDHVTVPLHQRPRLRIVLPLQDIAARLATVVPKFSK